jgi:hypothetical protein
MFKPLRWRAAGAHLGAGLVVSAALAAVVFLAWYPAPLHRLAGGTHLFFILLAVDVILGPCLTFVVFGGHKSVRERILDASVIVLIQLAALIYGMHALYVARPVALVYEYSKFTVLRAINVPDATGHEFLTRTTARFHGIPVIALRPFTSPEESTRYTFEALSGAPLQARRELWTAIEKTDLTAPNAGHGLERLAGSDRQIALLQPVIADAKRAHLAETSLRFLPITDRDEAWAAVFVSSSFRVIDLVPIDPYENATK